MFKSEIGVGIIGIGSCLPDKVLTNFDLEKMIDTSDEWITKRTGISERRILEKDEPIFSLGIKAAKRAIADAGIDPKDVDLILVTTSTPDYLSPSTSCTIQREVGAVNAAAFDLNAACSGFIYGMTVAQQFILTGYYKHVLLIACEGITKVVDWEDRNTCVLFGDGAGAVLLGPVENGFGILGTHIGADGSSSNYITIPCCFINEEDIEKRIHENKRVIWMDGNEVYKFAIKALPQATVKVLEKANIPIEDVKLIIPHQANIRIIEGASKRLGIPSKKVFRNLKKYGNMSSATIPIALEAAYKSKTISKGDIIVIVGFGGGLTWGSAVLKLSR